jgi:hypothetical protein
MNEFFEFFIVRLLWIWLPLYAFHRLLKDTLDDFQAEEQ